MIDKTSATEIFRGRLETALEGLTKEKENLAAAVVRGLLIDYNSFFPSIDLLTEENLSEYIGLYCIQDESRCPICGSKIVKRISKKGDTFYGCFAFPKCKGSRNEDKTISPTTAIREFLAEKLYREARYTEKTQNTLKRFSDIEWE